MTSNQQAVAPGRTIRVIHAAMGFGALLFAGVAHFVFRPTFTGQPFPAGVKAALLGACVVLCVLALFLRTRVRGRSSSESGDLFWTTAAGPALMMWGALELAGIMALVAYALSGDWRAIAAAVLSLGLFVSLSPALLERRGRG